MPDFTQTVQAAWEQPMNTQDPMLRMHVKLMRTARALKIWRRRQFSDRKIRNALVHIILLELEKAQERRTISAEELEFKKYLKAKSLGLAAIQKTQARQHSRLTWIRKGDANTRFFQMHANARRRKTYIGAIQSHDGIATSQQEKSKAAVEFFSQAFGKRMTTRKSINWQALGYSSHNLEDLDVPFTELELLNTIKALPSEKAPGPDGFIGIFYKKCWEIIKHDLYEALLGFYNHRTAKMPLFDEANIVLLPKNPDPKFFF
jgi:hypothetical protein